MADNSLRAPEDSIEYEELFQAACKGDVKRLEAALLPSLNINTLEPDRLDGGAALHIAGQVGSVPAIRFLIAHNAEVDLRDSKMETPLHKAAFWAQPEAISALLDAGADINLPTGDCSDTALHNVLKRPVTQRQIDTIKLLLDRGSDLNAEPDSWGSTLMSFDTR